ncbi:hypothetical protein DAPPUDRAFT_336773 [Daphnia pulex]|uniref:Uncharacterized protein n=1 Tax=Daphnia pulex TaxID=6669 RepID=E9I0B5_DAPPU|nr:hypothetical protein DAPPUDRAFT_336773 [Daphnia pulex]|eukprot:EFX62561.1 hypothetical protein DAPPUDRAFT_336773 [Daphnia pulex]
MGLRANFRRRITYLNNLISDKELPKKSTRTAGKWIRYSFPIVLIGYLDYFVGGIQPPQQYEK